MNPLLTISVIYSESSFDKSKKHSNNDWKGLGGINVKAHPEYKELVKTWQGNVKACVLELKTMLNKYNNTYHKAVTGYKGWSPRGARLATSVLNTFNILCKNSYDKVRELIY